MSRRVRLQPPRAALPRILGARMASTSAVRGSGIVGQGLVSFLPEIRSFLPELGRRHINVIKYHFTSYGNVSYTFIRFLHRASFYVINNHGHIRVSLKIIDHAGHIHIS